MYQVLYRKWRPKVFGDVVGQQHITGTLLSQINENRVAHAYLFTGSRGTGKTTCAKIFAKAINCLTPVNGEPCNNCEICRSIDNGSNLDVVEMDAASNRNLDDIKELLDEVSYPPSRSKFRVYIIDEVHMLTNFAFNALLKTLEEPPEYVRFVLATTEVQKMPTTILSRCQRFDFRRIEPDVIAERLMYITSVENGTLTMDAGEYIAKIADGGMRDSLSLLDRCLSITDNVTSDIVAESAGLIGREYLYDLLRAIGTKDTAKCLHILDDLHRNSCDTERLCNDLTECFRNFLVLKTVEHPEKLIVCTQSELETIREVASLFSDEFVIYALGILATAAESIKNSQNRRIEAEMAFIRLCKPESENSLAALTARINSLEAEIAQLKKNGIKVTAAAPAPVKQVAPQTPVSAPPATSAPVQTAQTAPVQKKETPPAPPAEEKKAETPQKKEAPAFSGFADAVSGNTFAAGFNQLNSDETEDDEPFDFDAFMKDAAMGGDDGPAVVPTDDNPFDDDFDDYPIDEYIPPEEEEGEYNTDFVEDDPFSAPAAAETPRAPTPPSPAYSATSSDGGATPIDRKVWAGIVKQVEGKSHSMIGVISGSTAVIKGATIYVTPDHMVFLNSEVIAKEVSPVAEEVLGKKYNIIISEGGKR